MGAVHRRLTGLVAQLRKQYPQAVAHADDVEVIAPRELSNRIHHMFTGKAIEPIFVSKPGVRTIVVPRPEGGVEYLSTLITGKQPAGQAVPDHTTLENQP